MIRIGITGSLASGKSTVARIISKGKYPIFNADKTVSNLYKRKNFQKRLAKIFNFRKKKNIKRELGLAIQYDKKKLKKLEQIVHPLVRKEMLNFAKKNKKRKFIFFEIPLLIESSLSKYFDLTIFIKSNKKLRLKRYKLKNKNIKLFYLLERNQLKDIKKSKLCDHIIVNNKSLILLKNRLLNIIKKYE